MDISKKILRLKKLNKRKILTIKKLRKKVDQSKVHVETIKNLKKEVSTLKKKIKDMNIYTLEKSKKNTKNDSVWTEDALNELRKIVKNRG